MDQQKPSNATSADAGLPKQDASREGLPLSAVDPDLADVAAAVDGQPWAQAQPRKQAGRKTGLREKGWEALKNTKGVRKEAASAESGRASMGQVHTLCSAV